MSQSRASRHLSVACLGVLALGGVSAYAGEPAQPQACAAKWSSVGSADVDGDGLADDVIVRTCGDIGAIGVMIDKKMRVIEFPLHTQAQFGVCGATLTATLGDRTEGPLEAFGDYPPGYKDCPNCAEITVDDGDCDPLHFYWRKDTQTLDWWRL